eukprot:scaffold7885_cov403-Prasinococcus_capsulatus_cf.AAC.2
MPKRKELLEAGRGDLRYALGKFGASNVADYMGLAKDKRGRLSPYAPQQRTVPTPHQFQSVTQHPRVWVAGELAQTYLLVLDILQFPLDDKLLCRGMRELLCTLVLPSVPRRVDALKDGNDA